MATRRKTLSQGIVIGTLVAAAFLGSLAAVFYAPPEDVRVVSADGRVSLRGRVSDPGRVRLFVRDDKPGPFTAVRSQVYEIDFGTDILPEPFQMTVAYESDWAGNPSDLRVYSWNRTSGAWQALPTVLDTASGSVSVEILSPAELWGVGVTREDLDVPREYDSLLNELVSFPPSGAVGYRASVAVASVPGDFVLLTDAYARGGCAGAFVSGRDRTVTSKEREAEGITYRVSVFWELGDGCPEESLLL